MKKLYCYSHCDFDLMCENNGWNNNNIPDDSAFISVCGTPDCQKYYLEETENHWFKACDNVLNLNFDDISTDKVDWKGHIFYGLSKQQAEETIKFIEKNKGKNFYIHCRAGQSRSQGFVRFILDNYKEFQYETRNDNPCRTPNIDVVAKLNEAFRNLGYFLITLIESELNLAIKRISEINDIENEERYTNFKINQYINPSIYIKNIKYFMNVDKTPIILEYTKEAVNKKIEFEIVNDLVKFLKP